MGKPAVDDARERIEALRFHAETVRMAERERSAEMLKALEALLDRYVQLVNCGDCGNWNPEDEDEVKAARAVIAKAREGHQ